MTKIFHDRVMVSIDIGTTKICVLIAHYSDDGSLEVLGIGKSPSDGLSKGVVSDIARTIRSIKAAVKEAETMAGITVESAYIGISGAHIEALNSTGVVPIKSNYVRESDVKNVLDAARAIPIIEGQQILHVLPQYFIIDGRDKVQDPLGMYGIRLEVQAHIILGSIASVQNLIRCCESAGIRVNDIVLEQLASADAVLSDDEAQLGTAVLDIGGGTSDLALFQNGTIRHTMVLPIAGNHFTNDVAIGLRTTRADAERVKKELGSVLCEASDDALISVELVQKGGVQNVSHSLLNTIIYSRAHELFSLVSQEIKGRNLESMMVSGLVLTGGGSLLHGMEELAQKIFAVPVRIGFPKKQYTVPQFIDNPMYATSYGLLIHAFKTIRKRSLYDLQGPLVQKVFVRMKMWVSDFF